MKPQRTILDEFEDLTAAVLDGTATPDERGRFTAITREYPEFRSVWLEQVRLHALLTCRGTQHSGNPLPLVHNLNVERWAFSVERLNSQRSTFNSQFKKLPSPFVPALRPVPLHRKAHHAQGWGRRWPAAAAAAALLLAGTAVWRGRTLWTPGTPAAANCPRPTADSSPSPVQLVHQAGATGLELPQVLPGVLRLTSGTAKVRLISGVELVLLGPLELEVDERGMETRLAKGRLVAWVPARASGFTVHAPGLTAWDIGTIFSMSTDADGSTLFVFKGSVQALDGAGSGVDICEAGEGVRSMPDRTPFKVAAEGETAERLFKQVRGSAAVTEPQKALDAARQIGELWIAKYVPEEASRIRENARRQAALRNAPKPVPFTKTAWVRPSAPVPTTSGAKILSSGQETSNMKTTSAAALLAAAAMTGAGVTGAASDPSVPILVDTSPCHNRHWTTVFTNAVPLRWNWVTNADSAQLEIVGMNGSVATNFTDVAVTNWVWQAFAPSGPSAEDVYDLTLTFKDDNAVVGALTSRLAVVTAAFGQTKVVTTPEDKPWPTLKGNVVLPYDAEWTEATEHATNSRVVIAKQGGITQTNALTDANGYFGWKVKRGDWGYGT
ncbi:MAG: hypothetical protein PHV28_18680, partial [Kiritimatiellae bacterium]|nr:hypothetical protein [Kiritimatiellia bacterium]